MTTNPGHATYGRVFMTEIGARIKAEQLKDAGLPEDAFELEFLASIVRALAPRKIETLEEWMALKVGSLVYVKRRYLYASNYFERWKYVRANSTTGSLKTAGFTFTSDWRDAYNNLDRNGDTVFDVMDIVVLHEPLDDTYDA